MLRLGKRTKSPISLGITGNYSPARVYLMRWTCETSRWKPSYGKSLTSKKSGFNRIGDIISALPLNCRWHLLRRPATSRGFPAGESMPDSPPRCLWMLSEKKKKNSLMELSAERRRSCGQHCHTKNQNPRSPYYRRSGSARKVANLLPASLVNCEPSTFLTNYCEQRALIYCQIRTNWFWTVVFAMASATI